MKKYKRIVLVILSLALLMVFPFSSFAHSGRTDSSGGHHDYRNKSGLGYYHYHCDGHPAHLHQNGICPYAPRDRITIKSYKSSMYVGDEQFIDYTIDSESFSDPDILSSNEDVIDVYDDKLIAINVGTSTITIKTYTASKSFTVTVKEVFAEDLELSVQSKKLQLDTSMVIDTKITPYNTTNKNLKFKSSDPSVVDVYQNGKLVGNSCGKATITVTTSNGISKKLRVKVFEVTPESIKCDDEINLIVGEQCDFKITILPENANNKDYDILVEDENIIQYSDDKLTAIKEGDTNIHIQTWNGIVKDIPIHIDIIPVENVEIIDSTKYITNNIIDKSDVISLSAKVSPDNATYKDIVWTSSDTDIVECKNNEFIIKNTGKVILTSNTHEDVTDSIEIIIIDKYVIVISSLFTIVGIAIVVIVCYKRNTMIKLNKRNKIEIEE